MFKFLFLYKSPNPNLYNFNKNKKIHKRAIDRMEIRAYYEGAFEREFCKKSLRNISKAG